MHVPHLLAPVPAHLGHLGEAAGHDHALAGAAIGAAVLAGLWAVWKGRRGAQEADARAADAEEATAEPEEAPS